MTSPLSAAQRLLPSAKIERKSALGHEKPVTSNESGRSIFDKSDARVEPFHRPNEGGVRPLPRR